MAPVSSPSRSKKLLITDGNPKQRTQSRRFAAPPNSASSSSTADAPPPEKRTRDLPNLSDCHCCGRRINQTNPKDRLQPMDSVWRIVLICRRCRKSIQSGATCTYCFRETGNSGNVFKCSVCNRKVHEDCVRDYGNCTPWCYLGVQVEGFRVCVDCWVPDLLKNSVKARGKSRNKRGLKDKGDTRDLVEKVMKGGKCEVENKVKTVENAEVLENALDLVNAPLDKKDRDWSKAENSNLNGSTEAMDDAELAIQLHRVINSSPRILRTKSSVNSNSLDGSSIRKWKGLSYKRSRLGIIRYEGQKLGTCRNSVNWLEQTGSQTDVNVNPGLLAYKRDKKRKIWPLHDENIVVSESRLSQPDVGTSCSMNDVSESSNCVYASNKGRTNVDRLRHALVSYKRTRFKQKICKVNGPIGVSGECSSSGNHRVDFKSDYCQLDDANLRTCCLVESDTHETFPSGNADAERDRYKLKYGKRVKSIITGSSFLHDGTCDNHEVDFKSECHQLDDSNLRNCCLVKSDRHETSSSGNADAERDRYQLKYGKRVKSIKTGSSFLHYDTSPSETQACEPGLSNFEDDNDDSVKCDGELVLPNGSHNRDPDRYCFKYTKRVKGSNCGSIFETKLHSGSLLDRLESSASGITPNGSAGI